MSRLRVLIAHTRYQQRGGEEAVVEAELDLLQRNGHAVQLYARDNAHIERMGKLDLLRETLWSRRALRDIDGLIASFRPDVVHFHNTFPLISPAAYWAAARAGIPVVQTLHNYRLLCVQAMLLREGKVCEDCLGKLPWRGVVRSCYHDSRAQSAAVVSMLGLHRGLGSYRNKVTRYIALNEFCRDKFVAGGLPAEKIAIKPNFIDIARGAEVARKGALFVGRLAPEKGLGVLTAALDRLNGVSVEVVGTGPEHEQVSRHPSVRAVGRLEPERVRQKMREAEYLIVPSLWYEAFPVVVLEAFACGLPVIASRVGALAEIIDDGKTGLLFALGSADELARKIAFAQSNPKAMREMGENARAEYEANYTPQRNYQQLMAIYADSIAARSGVQALHYGTR
jgi:glycosyltransferase involved in cell wall biosynthesis